MTYGEAHIAEQMSITLIKGVFTRTVYIQNKPPPLQPDEAFLHYRIKLFNHWVNDYKYDNRLSLEHRKEIVSTFMFGHRDTYKKYKELE